MHGLGYPFRVLPVLSSMRLRKPGFAPWQSESGVKGLPLARDHERYLALAVEHPLAFVNGARQHHEAIGVQQVQPSVGHPHLLFGGRSDWLNVPGEVSQSVR